MSAVVKHRCPRPDPMPRFWTCPECDSPWFVLPSGVFRLRSEAEIRSRQRRWFAAQLALGLVIITIGAVLVAIL